MIRKYIVEFYFSKTNKILFYRGDLNLFAKTNNLKVKFLKTIANNEITYISDVELQNKLGNLFYLRKHKDILTKISDKYEDCISKDGNYNYVLKALELYPHFTKDRFKEDLYIKLYIKES